MMKTPKNAMALLKGMAAVPALLALASCGESDNIQSSDVGAVSTCKSIPGASCVSGRFVDDAVANLNYECGLEGAGVVRSVTAADGGFSCPNGSLVTFSLVHPENPGIKLEIGSTRVVKPADLGSSLSLFFYVTPLDLFRDKLIDGYSNSSVNLARLLHTLSVDTADPALPSYRILISDDAKRRLTPKVVEAVKFSLAPERTDLLNPAEDTFDFVLRDYMQSFDPELQLISADEASRRLSRGVFTSMAGYYEAISPLGRAGLDTSAGMHGIGGSYFVGAVGFIVDRRGRMVGSGVYSYEPDSNTILWSNPKAMTLETRNWSPLGDLAGLEFRMVDSAGVPTGQAAVITSGNIRRQAVAGSDFLYRQLFNETPGDGVLARWRLTESGATAFSSGRITMSRNVSVATWMNPDLWNADKLSFPLAVKVTLHNSDSNCGPLGCAIGTFRMLILADGNVVSDIQQKCGVNLNESTLTYPSGGTEVSLGTVASISDAFPVQGGGRMDAMSVLVMIPEHPHFRAISPYLPYAQFGSTLGESSVLRTDGVNGLRSYGLCSADWIDAGQCSTSNTFAPDIASWGNRVTTVRAQKSGLAADVLNSAGVIVSQPTPVGECLASPPAP